MKRRSLVDPALECIDLTRVMDADLPIYTEDGYADPPLRIDPWCTVEQQGYRVAALSLGTQTGTHIDAPAHFVDGGETLEALPAQALIGPYLWIDLQRAMQTAGGAFDPGYRNEPILFLTSSAQTETAISPTLLAALLALPCRVWLTVYGIQVVEQAAFSFHRTLAAAGKYLIEEVDPLPAGRVRPGGELIALPLRLHGVSGSPCRVVVRQPVERVRRSHR